MREMKHPAQWEAEGAQEVVAQLRLLWRFYYEPQAATMELFPGEHSGLMVDVAHARRIIAEALGTADPLYVLLDTALRLDALPALRGALQTFTGQSSLLRDRSALPCASVFHPDPFGHSGRLETSLFKDTSGKRLQGESRGTAHE